VSASTEIDRRRDHAAASSKRSQAAGRKRNMIGVDFANFGTRQPSKALLPLLVLSLVVALGVASLRIDLIRTRYALAAAMADEKRLIEEQHELIVEKLQGRDPVELAVLARERGFRPANAARSMTDPMPLSHAMTSGLEAFSLPRVSAAPPEHLLRRANEGGTR